LLRRRNQIDHFKMVVRPGRFERLSPAVPVTRKKKNA